MDEIQKEQLQEITNLLYHILVKLPVTQTRVADDKLPTWLDNQDVMQLLHVSPSTLSRWRKNGSLRFFLKLTAKYGTKNWMSINYC